ncbi:EamA family transporter [Spirillospora sp. NBC_01491]|uniref:EamA family transporter n=1 Tax=Spirillospora sp. NBC_01491 TaxID=2976007 RepID=UPI002E371C61|nr:EamA family transporter [Spirillospora sp. NBC_01491]
MTATAGAGAGRRAALAPALVPIQITSLQVGAAAATHLFDRIGTWGTVSLRVILAALVLALLPGRRLGRITRRHLPVVCAYAAVISGMNFAFFAAIDHLPLSVATTIELLGPLTVALAAARSRSDAGWALLAAGGLVLLTAPGGLSAAGLAFAGAAAVLRGAYVLLTRRLGDDFPDRTGLVAAMILSALVWSPVAVTQVGARLDGRVLLLALAVGLFSSALPYSLDLLCLRYVTPHTFGVLLSLSPVISLAVGYVALAQAPRGVQLAGIALVVAASAGAVRTSLTRAPRPD